MTAMAALSCAPFLIVAIGHGSVFLSARVKINYGT